MEREDLTEKMFEQGPVRASHTALWREKCFSSREQEVQGSGSGAERFGKRQDREAAEPKVSEPCRTWTVTSEGDGSQRRVWGRGVAASGMSFHKISG